MNMHMKCVRQKSLCWSLLLSAVLFVALLFCTEGSRQKEVFPYTPYCDYRVFMLPCMTSDEPYSPRGINSFDACYPAIAYCMTSALSTDKGDTWMPRGREWLLLGSVVVLELAGLLLLIMQVEGHWNRLLVGLALLLSPAILSSVLRGNPSGWSFALVCLFLYGHDSRSRLLRIVAALSLGLAVALKLAPVLFGLLFLSQKASSPREWPWSEILVSASAAILLIILPFFFFGGIDSVPQWVHNALQNSKHYSMQDPIWGFVAILNRFDPTLEIPRLTGFAIFLTNAVAAVMAVLSLFVRVKYVRLICIGIAMAFLAHHDYGAAYMLPAFVAWLIEGPQPEIRGGRVIVATEWIAWFLILTPFQFPDLEGKSLNFALQGEAVFVLLVCAVIRIVYDKTLAMRGGK